MTFLAAVSIPPSRGDNQLKFICLWLNLEKKTLNAATKNNFNQVSPLEGVTRGSPPSPATGNQ